MRTLSLLIDLLTALSSVGGAGVAVSLGLDYLRRNSPLPGPGEQPPASPVERLYLKLLWTPAAAFWVAVGVSAVASGAAAALTGADVQSAIDQAIYNALSSQVTWAVRWLALNPRKRSLPVLED